MPAHPIESDATMQPRLSVIITCYNLERFIARAIESVIDQTSKQDIEIIVVDDASTDASVAVVQSYPYVRLIQQHSNGGVLLATIAGIRAARSDLIAFLDGDDVWMQEKISSLLKMFDLDEGIGLVTHDMRFIDADGLLIETPSKPAEALGSVPDPAACGELIRKGILEQKDFVWLGSAFAVRRSIIDMDAFCAFAEQLPDPRNTYQDWPLAVWCAAQPLIRMAYIPEKLFDYRIHGSNHSGDARTAEKAVRNVRRTLNTLLACESIIEKFDGNELARKATGRKREYYQSILDLYSGMRLRALKGFMRSYQYLIYGDASFFKEIARFVGVFVLGYPRFIRLVNQLS